VDTELKGFTRTELTVDKLVAAGIIPLEHRDEAVRELDREMRAAVRRFVRDLAVVTVRTMPRVSVTA
jgi:hypothetical protein